MEAYLFRTTI